jgi:hypothetical protein
LFGGCLAITAQAQDPPTPPTAPPASTTPVPQSQSGLQLPPALPKVPDVRQPGETGWWAGVTGWFPKQQPYIDKGRGATFTEASKTQFQGKPKYAEGAEIGFALGLHNALRATYFETRASGNFVPASDLRLWTQTYTKTLVSTDSAGKETTIPNLLTTDYRLQTAKLSFDYLSWPYPVESRRIRVKSLWQLQYTAVRSGFDAPKIPLTDETGAPFVDASGNQITYSTQGTRWFVSPEIGIGLAYFSGRHFRVEANASGFTIPRHNSIWDADASANFRTGHFELRVGAKGFHFKTSTSAEYFMRGTMYSGFVGLRWYSE